MTTTTRRGFLTTGLVLATTLGTGCTMLDLMAPEASVAPGLKRIAAADKQKEVRLVLVAYSGLETRPEFVQADRQLTEMLAHHLAGLFAFNKERVVVVSPRKVEEYKSNHPNWHQELDPAQIGKHFHADYVAFLDIDSLSLYEKGSVNQMYRGRAEIAVTLVDVNKKDDAPDQKEFTHTFPGEVKGPIPVGDMSLVQFRQLFLDSVAHRLAWYFTSHPTDRELEME